MGKRTVGVKVDVDNTEIYVLYMESDPQIRGSISTCPKPIFTETLAKLFTHCFSESQDIYSGKDHPQAI